MNRIALTRPRRTGDRSPGRNCRTRTEGGIADDRHARGKTPQLSTLLSLVKKAGLADELSGTRCTDRLRADERGVREGAEGDAERAGEEPRRAEACPALPRRRGQGDRSEGREAESAKTLAGPSVRIRVTGTTVRINNARVTTADVKASNGVVHVIDRVLIPPAA